MAREFKLPDIGEGVHEGEVVKWFVKEGDPIRENDPVVEVMTDKVTVQIPSPVTGKVLQLRAKEGEVVKVGATLVVFGEDGEAPPATPSAPAARPASSAPPPAPSRTSAPPPPPPSSGEALAAPAVRRLAKELNVNLGAVRGLRKRIFEKMAKSNVTAAHFTYVEEVDMSQLVHLREHLREAAERKGIKLTFLPFFIKSVLGALKEFPALNSSVDDEHGEIV